MAIKKIKNAFIPILIFSEIFFHSNYSFAQKLTTAQLLGQLNTVTTAVPFLMISPDSRAGGMGDAGVASTPDANSQHWNPSKYAFIDKQMGFSVSYTPWLRALVPDINLAYLSGYYKLKKNAGVISSSLRYFSLGDITFTDIIGNTIGQFRPNEFAYDVGYARQLGKHFAGGGAIRYIHSNLTGNITVDNAQTHAGNSVAADISMYYQSDEKSIGGKKSVWRFGANISNLGAKISYSNTGEKDFIPTNLKFGPSLHMQLDDYNEILFCLDLNKIMVPTPPVYVSGTNPPVVQAGMDPNVGVVNGILLSFNPADAPGGIKEKLKEVDESGGIEYWYAKQFGLRAGYFNEALTKGGRKYITAGLGVKYTVFTLDFSYLIPVTIVRSPLQNTLRFTMLFDFDAFKSGENTVGSDGKPTQK